MLAEEVVVIPLVSRVTMGAIWGDEVSGFEMNPTMAGPTWNIELWWRVDL